MEQCPDFSYHSHCILASSLNSMWLVTNEHWLQPLEHWLTTAEQPEPALILPHSYRKHNASTAEQDNIAENRSRRGRPHYSLTLRIISPQCSLVFTGDGLTVNSPGNSLNTQFIPSMSINLWLNSGSVHHSVLTCQVAGGSVHCTSPGTESDSICRIIELPGASGESLFAEVELICRLFQKSHFSGSKNTVQ